MPDTPLPLDVESSGPFAGIATLTLAQPGRPVVVLDHDLIRALEATLNAVPSSTIGLVLASASERAFVAGADLKAISELDDDALHRYLEYGSRVFAMLSLAPYWTVAAINGAALGGGLELAMHCDALVASPPAAREGQPGKPYQVGLPEAGLGLCPGWGGTNLLPSLMDPADAIRRTATGQTLSSDEAFTTMLFAKIAPDAGSLTRTAKEWILGKISTGSGKSVAGATTADPWLRRPASKATTLLALGRERTTLETTDQGRAVMEAVEVGLARGYSAALEVERRQLVRLRHTPRAKEALAAFFAKKK
ncbi:MAG: enoyl-CoA hydratase/isomerase family protein [Planctomycetota bacterium]|nr:enoyl-CoA hydratase/isomerase family protein [Planctomycetota bacterium]